MHRAQSNQHGGRTAVVGSKCTDGHICHNRMHALGHRDCLYTPAGFPLTNVSLARLRWCSPPRESKDRNNARNVECPSARIHLLHPPATLVGFELCELRTEYRTATTVVSLASYTRYPVKSQQLTRIIRVRVR